MGGGSLESGRTAGWTGGDGHDWVDMVVHRLDLFRVSGDELGHGSVASPDDLMVTVVVMDTKLKTLD
ncbi:hypothetical protein N7539_001658 [Penicillium diatomitis]|uniref:Uncharacterized protein n=1 Tax=Penicillium diatomitis TaxID=2819901 RepID=A0A9W9XH35_9EURO|nr:uncharacterized protein N7539_001658 [Penicillium diatomitis]KAJ5492912.1 hypothetical protein N7539_001658 [Penicillium diatomitis]